MAFEAGTASNAGDLLLKLETFLTTNPSLVAAGQQWKSMKDNTVTPYTTSYNMTAEGTYQLERCFIGGGLDGKDRIVVPMRLYVKKAQTFYSLSAYSARSWDTTKPVQEQFTATQAENQRSVISLWADNMPYWFWANGRRFMIVAKVANRYVSMYCGFFMPCGTDREYSYPLYIGGSHTVYERSYQHQGNQENGAFWKPTGASAGAYTSSGAAISPDGAIVRCYTSDMNTLGTSLDGYGNSAEFYPYQMNEFVGKTKDNQYVLKPIEIVQVSTAKQCLGWLDGAFYVSGFENSPENVLTVNGARYICFPTMVRTGFNDWCAIKME